MRKPLWVIPALLIFVALSAPNARADALTLTTTPGPTIGVLGTLSDTATLSGGFAGISPTGTITWALFDPHDGVVATPFVSVLQGDGTYGPVSFSSPGGLLIGTYRWAATYSGDSNYPRIGPVFETEVVSATTAAPEPGAVGLMLLGIGFVLVMRNRHA